jgi:hypothetical protein
LIGANGASQCRAVTAVSQGCDPGFVAGGVNAEGRLVCVRDQVGLTALPNTRCPAGQVVSGINPNGSAVCSVVRTGGDSCAANEKVLGINADGSVLCAIDRAGQAGVELPANTCGPGQALFRISADGTTACRQLHSGQSACPAGQMATGVNASGALTCVDPNQFTDLPARTCGAGQALYLLNADGTTACRQLARANQSCDAGFFARGINPNGALVCVADSAGLTQLPVMTCPLN